MAYLNQTAFRPACVISALPKRLRDSLSRELRSAVAVCTCPIEELEAVVQSRGATVAIVGVSEKTIDVAEQLSHSDRNLKVFLAKYDNGAATPRNGFAGVFDVRAEAKQLADSIKIAIRKEPSFPSREATFTEPVPSLLNRFAQLQRKIGNPLAFFDSMLEHLLNLTKGTKGFILKPDTMDEFRLVSSRGYNVPPVGTEFILDQHALKSGGAFGELFEYVENEARYFSWSIHDLLTFPLRSGNRLQAVFVSDKIHLSAEFQEMIFALGALFDQHTDQESKASREGLVAKAQSIIARQDGWVLVDVDGRIYHQNGIVKSVISFGRGRIKEPRIRDLIARCFDGTAVPIESRGMKITAHNLITEQGLYCVLEVKPLTPEIRQKDLASSTFLESLTLLKEAVLDFADADGKTFGEELIASIIENKSVQLPIIAYRLKGLGVEVDLGGAELPSIRATGIGLILLMAYRYCNSFTTIIERFENYWTLTVEFSEKAPSYLPFDPSKADLIYRASTVAGINERDIRSSTFGFQISMPENQKDL